MTRIVVLGAVVLLALDAGRSYYARTGYAQPAEVWQPNPAQYADLTWPPGVGVAASRPPGERVYAERCAVCHGPDGRGNGPAAPSMIPRPRDFTLALFKYKSTLRSEPPTDDDLRRVVGEGLPASAMPPFGDLLSDADIGAAVDEVKRFARFTGSQPAPVALEVAESDAASIERGGATYGRLGCAGCHGTDGRKTGYLQDA